MTLKERITQTVFGKSDGRRDPSFDNIRCILIFLVVFAHFLEICKPFIETGIDYGGGLIYGFDQMISSRIGIPVHTEEDAVCCVVKGTGIALERIDSLRDAKVNFPEKRFL